MHFVNLLIFHRSSRRQGKQSVPLSATLKYSQQQKTQSSTDSTLSLAVYLRQKRTGGG